MDIPSENETALIANFIEMTGLDFDMACHYLQAANYDISTAFSLLPEDASNDKYNSVPSAAVPDGGFYSPSVVFEEAASIRAADPVQQQQLLGGGVFLDDQRENAFARGEDPSVEWIFPPPSHINFPGRLQEVSCLS